MTAKMPYKSIKRPAPAGIPDAWFLMSRKEITVRDLRALFTDNEPVDMWALAGVLEIGIAEKESIDIEMMEDGFEAEEDRKFLEEKGVKTLFSLVFDPGYYDKAEPVLQKLAAGIDGFICGDTPDFTPVIGK